MADSKAIKNRINSVKNTAKITKALQMVSAAKMHKAQDRAKRSELYSETLFEIVNKIGIIKDFQSPYLKQNKEVKNIAILVIGTDRGFVGSMIANLIIETTRVKNELKQKYPNAVFHGVSLYKTGLKVLQNSGIKDVAHFAEYKDDVRQFDLTSLYSFLVEKFEKGEFDLIYFVYTNFINTLSQDAQSKKLLPLSLEEIVDKTKSNYKPFLFEPGQEDILNWILPEYFQTTIHSAVLSSIASEYSSRMVSMKKATDNANDLSKQLTLEYNKTRQADITQEIVEIVSGALS